MNSGIRRLIALAAILLFAATAAGCVESSQPQATGKGKIRGVNAIATAPAVGFKIEERELSAMNFKDTSAFNSFDDLPYNFNFDMPLPGQANPRRLATQSIDVQADHEYTVVLGGSVASPTVMFWDDPEREWSGSETVHEVFFAHLAPSLGEFDLYYAAPGTLPVTGQAVGSLTSGERLPVMEFEAGQYELTLTPKDDPATVVFRSVSLETTAQTRITLAIFEPDPTVPGNFSVNVLRDGGASIVLADSRFPSQFRTLHAAFGTQNFDGYFDSDFASVVYTNVAFGEFSPYADAPATTALLTLTPVGNSGATIHESNVNIVTGARATVMLAGAPGSLAFITMPDNARPLETYPVLRFTNASVNSELLDIYILDPGTPLEDSVLPQVLGLPSLQNTGFRNAPDGMVEMTVTLRGEKTPISVPLVLDLANGDRADVVIFDTADPAIVELLAFPF